MTDIALIAVDGGNSKTDVALVGRNGDVLGVARGPSCSHEAVGLDAGMRTIADLVAAAAAEGGLAAPVHAAIGVHCLAGADFASDDRLLGHAIGRLGLADRSIVRNDAFAGLRAGAPSRWGVSVVCGAGMNCVGVGPTGLSVRFAAVGAISGDWGGGQGLGVEALGAASRARDGRGPRTVLEALAPAHFGFRRPLSLVQAVRNGRVPEERLGELAPVVFEAATAGDAVARALVDRCADEVVLMAAAAIRRLHLRRRAVDVVLAGSVFRASDPAFHARIRDGVHAVAPAATIYRLEGPPVVGAALLGADSLGLGAGAERRIRAGITAARLSAAGPLAPTAD